jgi:hypothetical protein
MTRTYTSLTLEFDVELSAIPHYRFYPEMMVAVGVSFPAAPVRLLIVGESHYLDAPEDSNRPDVWYRSRQLVHAASARYLHTRGIVDNAINGRSPSRSKAIYHALGSALAQCGMTPPGARSALQAVAFMNYFQRPAEVSGRSVRVHPNDVVEAAHTITAVAKALQPDLIVFASRLGWKHAQAELAPALRGMGIEVAGVPHPATSWWNRPSRPNQGRTGRQAFMAAVGAANRLERVEEATPTRAAPPSKR